MGALHTLPIGPDGLPVSPLEPRLGASCWVAKLTSPGFGDKYPRRQYARKAADLRVGDAVQFGGDIPSFTTSEGATRMPEHRRWNGVIREITPEGFEVEWFRTDFEAAHAAYEARKTPPPLEWWEQEETAPTLAGVETAVKNPLEKASRPFYPRRQA